MLFEFEFNNDDEIEVIVNDNKEKYLIEIKYLNIGNFLVFSDTPTVEILQQEQGNKISILEAEKKALQESQDIQDRTIVENDMRMMDLEWALEDLIVGMNPTLENKNLEVFTMKLFERSAVYFNQLKQMIERENYDSKEDMERILNKYASGTRPRITQEEYDQLFDMLYPPVYDIPSQLPAE